MRFFKYLILLLNLSLFSPLVSADYSMGGDATYTSGQAACNAYGSGYTYSDVTPNGSIVGKCLNSWGNNAWVYLVQSSCPPVGYPGYFFQGSSGEIPQVRCMIIGGMKCKFTNPNPTVDRWITMSGSTVPSISLFSASTLPDPHCQDADNGTCNRNDPYSGCYVPPNDNCLRHSDGSISCPNNETPPLNPTCNGATYCNPPPEGCGTGYVGGSFNGQALCVSSGSSSTGTPTQPTSTSTATSTSTSSSTSTATGTGEGGTNVTNNTTTTNNNTNTTSVSIDVSGIINAINTLKNSMNPFLNEINNGVQTLNTSITGTNQKLDTANSSLNSINQKTQTTNEKLQELIDKPNGTSNGTGFSDTGIINAIEDQTTQIKDFFTPDESLKSQFEAIGNESNDGRYLGSQNNASSSLQSLANAMTFSNAACVPDLELDVPIYGSITIPLSKWCDILAIVKIFIQLAALILAFRMINESVRSF